MADQFTQKSEAFLRWLQAVPGFHINPKIQLTDLRANGEGRGVVALQDIREDEELFTVPRAAMLTPSTSSLVQRLPPNVIDDFLENQWLLLILVLMYEYLRGDGSSWKPYLDVLPESFDTLMFWSDDELRELQASAVRNKIGREEADETFKREILPCIKNHVGIFYPHGVKKLDDEELLALAHRMGSTIMAYAFDLEKDASQLKLDEEGYATEDEEQMPKGMVAMADMLNADADFNARLFQGAGSVTMKAVRRIRRGEEVLNDYGPLPRADLLRRYGYITEKYAKYDVVEIPRDLLLDSLKKHGHIDDETMRTRLDFLDQNDLVEDAYVLERDAGDTGDINNSITFSELPQDLTDFLKIFLSKPDEYKKLSKIDQRRHSELMVDVGRIMADVLKTRVNQYKTSMMEDRELLLNKAIQGRHRTAIIVRVGEKEVLKEAQAYASSLVLTYEPSRSDPVSEPSPKKRKLT